MNLIEIIQFGMLFGFLFVGIILSVRQTRIEFAWRKIEAKRERMFKELADPKRIEAEMEKGTRLREMKDAQRTTLPREDAGPPATVHRPLLRGQKPGSWRPRNPGNPSGK